jgi:hypothetical protein
MFRSIMTIFKDLLNINEAYIKYRWIIKYINNLHKTFVGII